jgi:RimJ/RimL family protein N-acetyltransferase
MTSLDVSMTNVVPNLSLLDTCLDYILHHPEIDRSYLPVELRDHLDARHRDPCYRVNPRYSYIIKLDFDDQLEHHMKPIELYSQPQDRAKCVRAMMEFLCENRHFLSYRRQLGCIVQNKLYEFYFYAHRAQPFYRDWNEFHQRLFGKSLQFTPPQVTHGLDQFPWTCPIHPVTSPPSLANAVDPDPSLIHETIILRPLQLTDAPDLAETSSDPSIQPYCHGPMTRAMATALIQGSSVSREMNSSFIWAIVQRDNHALIGCIGLVNLDPMAHRGQVSYWIDSRIPRQDCGLEAVDMITHWATTTQSLVVVDVIIDATNDYVKDLLQQIGYIPITPTDSIGGQTWRYYYSPSTNSTDPTQLNA